jgi:pimeloyl-ACP methyl ester carboxylesterase
LPFTDDREPDDGLHSKNVNLRQGGLISLDVLERRSASAGLVCTLGAEPDCWLNGVPSVESRASRCIACRLTVGTRSSARVTGAGPPVVLTHDGFLHRETWNAQFETFSTSHRVARWDRRGYGASNEPSGSYSSVDDLARVVRFVSDSPATLIGCSFGGLLSLHCALDRPHLVSALVLVGPIVSGLGFSEHFLSRGGVACRRMCGRP